LAHLRTLLCDIKSKCEKPNEEDSTKNWSSGRRI